MPAYSAVWVIVIAVLLAAGLGIMMMASRRPEGGYAARVRDLFAGSKGEQSSGTGAIAEHRDAAGGESVGLADIMANADYADAYVTVPERYEARFEELSEGLLTRQRALVERVRTEREERAAS